MPNKTSSIQSRIFLLGNRQSTVESEEAERGFRTLRGDFEQVTRPQNKLHDVIDMDRNVVRTIYFDATLERQKRESVWKFEKCFVLKVARGSTVLTRLPRTVSPCE
jgi:hypothetical protein